LVDEADNLRLKTQEYLKENTELRLRIDVEKSFCAGVQSEKQHVELELSEAKELLEIFKKKN